MRRADDVSTHQNKLKEIVQNISDANLTIADLTTQNANVYYELGIAHALLRPTIQIVQSIDDVPFDLRPYTVVTYSEHFTQASKLKDELLGYIEREEGDEYNFSNPVSDTLGVEVRLDKRAPLATAAELGRPIRIDQLQTPHNENDEVEDSQDEEMGLLDGIVAAEEASDEMYEVVSRFANEMTGLSQKTNAHVKKVTEINADPVRKGRNSKLLQVARLFATDLNDFSSRIQDDLPRLNQSWKTTGQGLESFIRHSRIKDDEELAAVEKLIRTIESLKLGLEENRQQFKAFREAQANIRGLSKVTDRGLTNSDRTIQMLDGEFGLGESVIIRAIELLNSMIDRYLDTHNADDGLDPNVTMLRD